MDVPESIRSELERYDQLHLLRWWEELDGTQRRRLLEQLSGIDFSRVQSLIERCSAAGSESGESAERAARAGPPERLVRRPESGGDPTVWTEATDRGWDLLRAGTVGAILVAGGQGTRLGSDRPKGMFPIGPVSGKSLFQLHCEQLRSRAGTAGCSIPYFIMTSSATHEPTVRFFQEHAFFGLSPDDVYFFQQGSLPVVDDATSRILLAAKDRVSSSPDGHGGVLHALRAAGLEKVMRDRGLEHLFYHQVDNPTAIICDPAFLGLHVMHQSQLSTKAVAKKSAGEKMGLVVSIDGRTEIIEYSNLSPELANRVDADGRLLLWAGSTAMHVFDRRFLERLQAGEALAWHVAHKAVPYLGEGGELMNPGAPNAYKFEQFIFDALPHAERTLVVEADRSVEFNPVKNATGENSPETARAGILRNARRILEEAGFEIADGVHVELSPLFAANVAELRAKLDRGRRFESDVVLE